MLLNVQFECQKSLQMWKKYKPEVAGNTDVLRKKQQWRASTGESTKKENTASGKGSAAKAFVE
jgi:hypothetical protein